MNPLIRKAILKERKACQIIAEEAAHSFRFIADKAKAAGDENHKKECLLRAWATEEICNSIKDRTKADRKRKRK